MARIALELGQPLMPWQRQVVDVGLELLPDGRPAYREVVVLTPRQQGKTTMQLGVEVHRAVMWPEQPQRIGYSAQTGADARKKLLDDQVPILQASPLSSLLRRVYRAVGAEGVIFRTGSRIDVMANTEAAGHGRVVDLGIIDEAFADDDDRREQAVKPAMLTKPTAQLWVTSTAGHEGSVYLRRKVDVGRAAVADAVDEGVAYFEWSADEDADIEDPATWYSCMPALGRTITEAVVRLELSASTPEAFRRAYLNQWTIAEERVIPAAAWAKVLVPDLELAGALWFGVDVSADRSAASIVAVDGARRAELIDHRDGTGWLAKRVAELVAKWDGQVVADERGPVAPLLADIEAAGIPVVRLGAAQMAAACGRLYDDIADRAIRVRAGSPELDAAVAGARKGVVGDAWYWRRRDAKVDISPLVALTVAHDQAVNVAAPWFHVE